MKHPTLFISHGSPNTILYDSKTTSNLNKLSHLLDTPKYIIVFSAHWTSNTLEIINPNTNKLMYDFSGFEQPLYEYQYPIQSNQTYSKKVLSTLEEFDCTVNLQRDSYDHGVWTALAMIKKSIDIPVIQVSLPMSYTPTQLFKVGEALNVLRDEALIIGSGSLTHNLYQVRFNTKSIAQYAESFNEEIIEILKNGDISKLLDFSNIKNFKENHPTIEHFIPLIIAAGASKEAKAHSINSEFTHFNISMESFLFQG